jgi:hypothetical protein
MESNFYEATVLALHCEVHNVCAINGGEGAMQQVSVVQPHRAARSTQAAPQHNNALKHSKRELTCSATAHADAAKLARARIFIMVSVVQEVSATKYAREAVSCR